MKLLCVRKDRDGCLKHNESQRVDFTRSIAARAAMASSRAFSRSRNGFESDSSCGQLNPPVEVLEQSNSKVFLELLGLTLRFGRPYGGVRGGPESCIPLSQANT